MNQVPVVIVTGAPGAGKSSTARELARLLGAALLDQDSMTNPLVDVVAGVLDVDDYDDDRLAAAVRSPRYECLLRVAADCVGAGVPAVLVAPFTSERRDRKVWDLLAQQIAGFGGRAYLAWLRIGPDELAARLRGRSAVRDARKLADLERYVAGLDLEAPVVPFHAVDATLTPTDQARWLVRDLDLG